jgi:hypothetical protein
MKLNYNALIALAFNLVASAAFSAVYAQDAQYPNIEHLPIDSTFLERERPSSFTSEPEPKTVLIKIVKDSASVLNKNVQQRPGTKVAEVAKAQVKTDTDVKEEKSDDDSVLSFNFLYYIFQKYKLQDIVD